MSSQASKASPASPASRGGIGRVISASLIGTTIEWYDNSSEQRYDLRFPFF